MVTNDNPSNPNIKEIIHKNWNIISNSPDCGPIFTTKQPIIGFKRLLNLRDMLTSSNTVYPPQETKTTPQYVPVCTRLGKCTYCPLIKKEQKSYVTLPKTHTNLLTYQNKSHVNLIMSYI